MIADVAIRAGAWGIVITPPLFAAMHGVIPGTPTWPGWLAAVAQATCNPAAMVPPAFSRL